MKSKKQLRQQIIYQRLQLSPAEVLEKSKLIQKKVCSHPTFLNAPVIYIYIDYHHEVSTRSIIETAWKLNKIVAAPKIIDREMKFYQIHTFDDLAPGTFGILEPLTNECISNNEGLMIMPGVVFDVNCHRIGYGKGFYDRYLNRYPALDKIALAFDLQIVDQIETEPHDINPQFVITESQIYVEKRSKIH